MPRYITLEADQTSLALVSGNLQRVLFQAERAVALALPTPLTPATANDLGGRLKDLLRGEKIAPAPLVVVVPRERLQIKEIKYPIPEREADEPSLVRFQAARDLNEALDEVVIDYDRLAAGELVGERRALAVVIRKEWLNAYRVFAESAGLKLVAVVPRPHAAVAYLQQALRTATVAAPATAGQGVALLVRGERFGELSILRQGQIVLTRTLGNAAIHSDSALYGELKRTFTVHAGANPNHEVRTLYVIDPNAAIVEQLSGQFGFPVHRLDPNAGQAIPIPTPPGITAGLLGGVQFRGKETPAPIDFLAPKEPRPERDPNAALVKYVLPILGVILLAGLGFGWMLKMDKDRKLNFLLDQKNDLEKQLANMEEDAKRIKALDEWVTRDVNWLDELYDLTADFPDPAGTRLVQFSGVPREIEKNAKNRYVAKMELKVVTEDGKAIDKLLSELVKDGHYRVDPKEPRGTAGAAAGRFNQQFALRADIAWRNPSEYTRVLDAVAPVRPGGSRQEFSLPGFPTGGGFGGVNGFGGNP